MNSIQRCYAWLRRPNKSTIEQYIETFVIILPIAFVIRTFLYGLYQVPTPSMETTMLVGERFVADKFTYWFIRSPQRNDIIACNEPEYVYSENSLVRLWQMYVWGPQNWTKRIIGIPGDHVQGKIEDGKPVIYLNGNKLEEPYVNKYPILLTFNKNAPQALTYRSYDPAVSYADQPFYRLDPEAVTLGKQLGERLGWPDILYPNTPHYHSDRIADIFDITLGENQYWAQGDNRQGSYDARSWGGTGKPLDGKAIHGRIVYRLWSLDSDSSWWIFDLLRHPIDFWKQVRWNRCFQWIS